MMSEENELLATEVRAILDEIPDEGYAHTSGVPETLEGFAERIVEDGTYWPNARAGVELSLTLRERLTGHREQDVTAILCAGLVLGAALERDIPADTEAEEAWRSGLYRLPEAGTSGEEK